MKGAKQMIRRNGRRRRVLEVTAQIQLYIADTIVDADLIYYVDDRYMNMDDLTNDIMDMISEDVNNLEFDIINLEVR